MKKIDIADVNKHTDIDVKDLREDIDHMMTAICDIDAVGNDLEFYADNYAKDEEYSEIGKLHGLFLYRFTWDTLPSANFRTQCIDVMEKEVYFCLQYRNPQLGYAVRISDMLTDDARNALKKLCKRTTEEYQGILETTLHNILKNIGGGPPIMSVN